MVRAVGDISQIEEFLTLRFRVAVENNLVFWIFCFHIMARIGPVLIIFAVKMEIGIGAVGHRHFARRWL